MQPSEYALDRAGKETILDLPDSIEQTLNYGKRPSDTLVSKVMLGVFGNVPAFDSFFKSGFGVTRFDGRSIEQIADYYQQNNAVIDKWRVPTLDFTTGKATNRLYTRAKVIDMVFFIEVGGEA